MATVYAPSAPRHPSPFRRAQKITRAVPTAHPQPDPYYGHEECAKICSRFVTHLFACPDFPPLSSAGHQTPSPPLALFIAYALYRTRLHASVTFAALYLLQRLKARFPAARGSSGHRLFISAFMIASKVICDDTYSNKSWSIVGQGMFALREINQMEREMCSYLEWQLNIEPSALREFEIKVRRDFKGHGPYPTYVLPSPAPTPVPSTTPYTQSGAPVSIPVFDTAHRVPSSVSPPKTSPPPPPAVIERIRSRPQPAPLPPSQPPSAVMPPYFPQTTSPVDDDDDDDDRPDTPEASHSNSTSPASSASPPTPRGMEDFSAKIVDSQEMGIPMSVDSQSAYASYPHKLSPFVRETPAASSLRKARHGVDTFAQATTTQW